MKLLLLVSSVLSVASLTQAANHYSHPCEKTYNIVQADDCKSIAATYGVTEAKLQQWNQYFDPEFQCNSLKAGDHVCVQFNEKLLKRAVADAHKKKAPGPQKPKKSSHKIKKEAAHHKKAPAHKKLFSHHKKNVALKMAPVHKKEAVHGKKSSHDKKGSPHKKAPAHKGLGKRSRKDKSSASSGATVTKHHKKEKKHHKKEKKHGKPQGKKQESK